MAKKTAPILFDDQETISLRISVRDLVEFVCRSGDLDSRASRRDPDAMQAGARMHRKLQKAQGSFYSAEVPLQNTCMISHDDRIFALQVEGRADGILNLRDSGDRTFVQNEALAFSEVPIAIDEIKCVLREISGITEPVPVHLAQAKCYAHFICQEQDLDTVAVQMTYCSLASERVRYFTEFYTAEELSAWYLQLCQDYCRFAAWEYCHKEARDLSIQGLDFPFSYRPGQKQLVTDVYRTILRKKNLFLEAPTGVGKTLSTIYPTVLSMGQKLTEKVFYLTAKTITRTVAEEAFSLLLSHNLVFLPLTLTAKEKTCILEKPQCNPEACPRAKGHYDRINDALYVMLSSMVSTDAHAGSLFNRDLLLSYAEQYQVCPYEMSLDLALFADAVICDYNYAFDPNVYLRRFFASEVSHDYVFLIDESHNLVDRAREMYSADLVKEDLLAARRLIPEEKSVANVLNACNTALLTIRKQYSGFALLSDISVLLHKVMNALAAFEDRMAKQGPPLPEEVISVYLQLRHFYAMSELTDDHYRTYCNYREDGSFFVRLQCMDPSRPLQDCLAKGRSAVFFSATLLPVRYYKEQLGGTDEDYAVYAPSPFDPQNRRVLIAPDVSTRYRNRTDSEYAKIAEYIRLFVNARVGNYLAFFPSYQFLQKVASCLQAEEFTLLAQTANMSEQEREAFLQAFSEPGDTSLLGLCVMGGIFSEGIDLRNDSLIGAVIVGPGLPMFCEERELFRNYFDEQGGTGFAYSYLYPGMNKVLQSAGRVIRTTEDRGAILLLDERFRTRDYQALFPLEWQNISYVTQKELPDVLRQFWDI